MTFVDWSDNPDNIHNHLFSYGNGMLNYIWAIYGPRPNPACQLLQVYNLQTKNSVCVFKWVNKNFKKPNILWYLKITWNFNFSAHESSFLGRQARSFVSMLSMATFALQQPVEYLQQIPDGLQA